MAASSSKTHIAVGDWYLARATLSNEVALELLENVPLEIAQTHDAGDYAPNFLESYNDLRKITCKRWPDNSTLIKSRSSGQPILVCKP
jgi:hypothetical protein